MHGTNRKLTDMVSTSSALALLLVIAVSLSSIGFVFNTVTVIGYGVLFIILAVMLIAVSYLYTGLEKGKPEKSMLVCPQCGSYDISLLRGNPLWFYGWGCLSTTYFCENCGYKGLPLELDSAEDYEKFMELKKKEKADALAESIRKRRKT
jgi:hypothetical protein